MDLVEEEVRTFASHPTAAYVSVVEEVRPLGPNSVLLRAVAGMVPPGKEDIMPERNAVQTLVATRHQGQWKVAVFQNTPAAFDGRPDEREKLNKKLRAALRQNR